jgi:phage terminase small subunit
MEEKKLKKLTPRQSRFLGSFLETSNGTKAAIAAGYSEGNAKKTAYLLLHKNASVMAAVDEARKALAEKAQYSIERAMREAEEAMAFAKEHKNPNALVKAVELRSKLNGLLIEKHDVRALGGFQIQIVGVEDKEGEK